MRKWILLYINERFISSAIVSTMEIYNDAQVFLQSSNVAGSNLDFILPLQFTSWKHKTENNPTVQVRYEVH